MAIAADDFEVVSTPKIDANDFEVVSSPKPVSISSNDFEVVSAPTKTTTQEPWNAGSSGEVISANTPVDPSKISTETGTGEGIQAFTTSNVRGLGGALNAEYQAFVTPLMPTHKLTTGEVELSTGLGKKPAAIAAGLQRAVGGTVDFFTSPAGIATLGVGALPKAAQKLIALGFATDMASNTPEIASKIGKAYEEGDTGALSEGIAQLGLNSLFVVGGAAHGLGIPKEPPGKFQVESRQSTIDAMHERQPFTETEILAPETAKVAKDLGIAPIVGEVKFETPPEIREVQAEPATLIKSNTEGGAVPSPATTPEKPPSLTPALLVNGESVPAIGQESHADIARRIGTPDALTAAFDDANHIFLDENGTPLDREQSKPKLDEINGNPIGTQKEPVQSAMLPTPEESNVNSGALGDVGMDAAKPGETTPEGTSLKNATADLERVAHGFPEANPTEKRSMTEAWIRANEESSRDSSAGAKLAEDLKAHPERGMTDDDSALLLRHKTELLNAKNQAASDSLSSDPAIKQNGIERFQRYSKDLLDLLDAIKARGSHWGREGRWRQALAFEDFSMETMERDMRAGKGGRELTDAERTELQEAHKKIEELTAKQAEAESGKAASEKAYQEEIDRMKTEASKQPRFSPAVMTMADRIVSTLHTRADAARIRLREKLSRVSSGVDPTIILDLAEIGAEHVANGVKDLAEFTSKMLSDFGDSVAPYLKEAWDKANAVFNKTGDDLAGKLSEPAKRAARTKKEATPEERLAEIKSTVSEAPEDKATLTKVARELARNAIDSGITERDSVRDHVFDILKDAVPNLTKEKVRDAISRYGQYKPPSQEATTVRLAEISGEYQKVAQLEAIEKGQQPLKTGQGRVEGTDEYRRLTKLVNEAKKKFGIVTTDPVRALKSSLDAIKTRLVNAIADVQHEIATRTKIIKEKSVTPTTPEIESLRKQLADLRTQKESIFGKAEKTDAERVRIAMSAVEKSITDLEARIKSGDVGPRSRESKTPNTPELEAARARRDALAEQLKELRDLAAEPAKESEALEKQKANLEKDIAEKERKLKESDLSTPGKRQNRPASNPEIEQLKQRRDALAKNLAKARAKPTDQVFAERMQRRLDKINQEIDEKLAKVAAGDVSSPSGQRMNRPMSSPELEQAKQQLESVNSQLADLRKQARPVRSPEEIALQRLKTAMKNREADYRDRIARQDFSPKPKTQIRSDPELEKARADTERAKNDWRKAREIDRLNNRSTVVDRIIDFVVALSRGAILSGPQIITKLGAAAYWRSAGTIAESGVGAILRQTRINEIAKHAPAEGRMRYAAIDAAISSIRTGLHDAWSTLKTGESPLTEAYGRPRIQIPTRVHTALSIPGRIHAMIKAPIKRAVFEMSIVNRTLSEEALGKDVSDPIESLRITKEAYADAERSIFQDKNELAQRIGAFERQFKNKSSGEETGVSRATRLSTGVAIPIRTVPANIVSEAFNYLGGLIPGSIKARRALIDGAENLKPEEADQIMRHLKKGALGPALLLLGWYGYKNVVGFYQPGQKPDDKKPKFGSINVAGGNVDKNLLHFPAIEIVQMGATIHQVADEKVKKQERGIGEGALAGVIGLLSETPVVRETFDYGQLRNPNDRPHFMADWVRSRIVPAAVSFTAQQLDKDAQGNVIQRRGTNFMQRVAENFPGARNNVPLRVVKPAKK